MDISIIIVNYNTAQITKQCLDSIFRNTKNIDFEVIVIDNASTDDSHELLTNYPNIIYIESSKNLGFGKANNLGYQYSSGEFVLLLNSDTILKNNAIKIFYEEFKKQPDDTACIGSWLLSPDGTINNSFGKIPSLKEACISTVNLYTNILKKGKGDAKEYDHNKIIEVGYIIGADLCIRRQIIEKLGLFDPDFFMYYEESEMQYRYHKAGYKMKVIPGPQIIHLECASTKVKGKKYTYKNRIMFFTSYFLFMRKIYSYCKYLFFRILFLFNAPIFFRPYYSKKEILKLLIFICSPLKKHPTYE